MSVVAIGVDIIETERIKKAIEHWGEHFLFRIFTPAEVAYCRAKELSHYSFAARFAVKEAVIKAIGTGLTSNVRWTSIEIVNDRKGKAEVRLGPGSYMMQPGGNYRHTTSCDKASECVFFVESSGKFDLRPVEPAKK